MDKINNTLVQIISVTVSGQKPENINLSLNDWDLLYKNAIDHQVHLIAYNTCKSYLQSNPLYKDFLKKWKNESLITSLYFNNRLTSVLESLNDIIKSNIPVLALKGLYYRTLYPVPETRVMGDVDLLINKSDFSLCTKILNNHGYQLSDKADSTIHYTFTKKNSVDIELHHSLMRLNRPNAELLNKEIWEDSEGFTLNNLEITIPSPMNHLIYCCIHMAIHFINGGFGLRQLCDFMLQIKNIGDSFEWRTFIDRTQLYGVGTFSRTILLVCNEYFRFELPEFIFNEDSQRKKYIEALMEEILESGTFGHKSCEHATNISLSKYVANHKNSRIKYFFPPRNQMNHRYSYVKKYPLLLPIAWFHRLAINIFRTDINLNAKIPNQDIINKHLQLVKFLEIQL